MFITADQNCYISFYLKFVLVLGTPIISTHKLIEYWIENHVGSIRSNVYKPLPMLPWFVGEIVSVHEWNSSVAWYIKNHPNESSGLFRLLLLSVLNLPVQVSKGWISSP